MFHESFKKFQGCFKEVSRKFHGYLKVLFKGVSRMCKGNFKIDECIKGNLSMEFQGYFKEVMEVSGVFRECFKKV